MPSLETGIDSSAVALFVERARAVAPHFSITGDADAVVEIALASTVSRWPSNLPPHG